jgi:8-oxo-dGTP pyrophosphatase MutT (NUDIX family)
MGEIDFTSISTPNSYNSPMKDLHKVQMQILRELTFRPSCRFTDLNISGLTSDHFSYHIKVLIEQELVSKNDDVYLLTTKGKKYCSHIDTQTNTLEKQPKISVLIIPHKIENGKDYYLVQRRGKEPYFGYVGFMTGKIRFGEKLFEAGARELMEEMGLTAEFEKRYILHEMVYDKSGSLLEDKYFHVLKAFDIKGDLLENTEDGENLWITEEGFYDITPKFHNEIEILEWYKSGTNRFLEEEYFIEKF